jgi:pseudaminic acid biosynthesis-associated methylase
MAYKTEQEEFWAGIFGTEYIERNNGEVLVASNLNFFIEALQQASGIKSCIEFGANIGLNLSAIKLLYPGMEAHAIEINSIAAKKLENIISTGEIYNQSILEFIPKRKWDLVLIKGVLIHINPDELPIVYDKLVDSCGKYLLVAEYYNPVPAMVTYRGHANRLFKRDFAGEILDRYPQMKLVDYGFVYHRDHNFPQDDVNWFLLENKKLP